jgi:hypothetical protein
MSRALAFAAAMAASIAGGTVFPSGAPAQEAGQTGVSSLIEAVTQTTRTSRSHSIAPGASAGTLEGTACTGDFKVVGGACHPGFSDRVRIINQFPNVSANTWRCGFKNNATSQQTVWVYTVCGRDAGPPLVTHNLTVRRHTASTLNNADANRIMGDANTVIQVSDGPGDIACNMDMVRTGNVGTFAVGTGAINSAADFTAVIQSPPPGVKVVNQINWCGGLIPGVIGCAPVPGTSFVVVRFTPSLEGILWLHEFGHNKGLPHRNDVNAVMAPSIAASRRHVNQAECDAFRAQPAVAAVAFTILPAEAQEMPQDVRDFVRQIYFHGVPFEQARQFGEDDLAVLEQMLQDPAEEPYWQTIVVTMGMIGEPEAAGPLIEFITEPTEGQLSPDHYRAKTNAVMSLGYLVNLGESQEALDFLTEAARPAFWTGEALGMAPFHADAEERNIDLATHAVLGLALAATDEAIEALRELRDTTDAEVAEFQRASGELIAEAIREAEQIREEGLEEYYEHDQHTR